MVLNLSRMEGDDEIKATIVHQFGHALGLGHTLMKPEEWNGIMEYLDEEGIKDYYGAPTPEEELDRNYDEDSIMHCM